MISSRSSLLLETILLSKEHPVIAGDFNMHVDVPQNPDSVKLLDLLVCRPPTTHHRANANSGSHT